MRLYLDPIGVENKRQHDADLLLQSAPQTLGQWDPMGFDGEPRDPDQQYLHKLRLCSAADVPAQLKENWNDGDREEGNPFISRLRMVIFVTRACRTFKLYDVVIVRGDHSFFYPYSFPVDRQRRTLQSLWPSR